MGEERDTGTGTHRAPMVAAAPYRVIGAAPARPGMAATVFEWLPAVVGVSIVIGLLVAVFVWRPDVPEVQPVTFPVPSGEALLPAADPSGLPDVLSPSAATPAATSSTRGPAAPSALPRPTGSGRTGPDRTDPGRTDPGRTDPGRTDPAGQAEQGGPAQRRPEPVAPRPVPAAPPAVTGRYAVIGDFPDSFIGEVRVANAAAGERAWEVRLEFAGSVGELRAVWVEGGPQPTVRRSGQRLLFQGAVPLAGGRVAPLRFQFARNGQVNTPLRCTVNGDRCGGLR